MDDQEAHKLKQEVTDLHQKMHAKEKLIDFLTARLEKVRNETKSFI